MNIITWLPPGWVFSDFVPPHFGSAYSLESDSETNFKTMFGPLRTRCGWEQADHQPKTSSLNLFIAKAQVSRKVSRKPAKKGTKSKKVAKRHSHAHKHAHDSAHHHHDGSSASPQKASAAKRVVKRKSAKKGKKGAKKSSRRVAKKWDLIVWTYVWSN